MIYLVDTSCPSTLLPPPGSCVFACVCLLIYLFVCRQYISKLIFGHQPWRELKPEISILHMKVLTLIKAKSNVFLWYGQCCSCTRRSKSKILTTRAPSSWIAFDVVTSHRQTRLLEYGCDCWFPSSCVYWSLVKARKIVWESQVIDSSSITQSEALWVWRCHVTTSNSFQDGGALVVNILVFDLCVQLQHCTYQRKTLFFALIKVSTFICKREISGLSSPLTFSSLRNNFFCTKVIF